MATLGAAAEPPPPATLAPLAPRSLLLDVAAPPGGAIIAVGERGHVLLSHAGDAFVQSPVPVRSTLTGVSFVDAENGWVVGHDEAILATRDGGRSWQLQHYAPERQQPLLAVTFTDARHGVAVGAYATLYETSDGGTTWRLREFAPRPLPPPPGAHAAHGKLTARDLADDDDAGVTQPHLNAIARGPGQRLYLAAEAGHLYRSDDAGASWAQLPSPYDGSFFGVLPLDGDSLLVYGLRGHLYRSDDGGHAWRAIDSHSEALLAGGTRLGDGTIVLVGLAGTVLVSRDGGERFALHQQPDRKGLAAVAPTATGVVVVGEAGLRVLTRADLGLGG